MLPWYVQDRDMIHEQESGYFDTQTSSRLGYKHTGPFTHESFKEWRFCTGI
jgi:hypothetical protein